MQSSTRSLSERHIYRYHNGSLIVGQGTPPDDLAKSILLTVERPDVERVDITFLGKIACYQAFLGALEAAHILCGKGRKVRWRFSMPSTYAVTRHGDEWVYDTTQPRRVSIFHLEID